MTANDDAAEIFKKIPPYQLIEGFLGADLVSRLLLHAVENECHFQDSRVGDGANERVNHEIRISSVLRDLGDLKEEIKSKFLDILPETLMKLGMSSFELHSTELELAAHGNGAFYNTHIDTFTGKDHKTVRVLTAVYYLHSEPKAFQGGDLRLLPLRYGAEESNHLDIEPVSDRLVLFPSWAPHRVMPVISDSTDFRDSRFAINCWYRKLKV